MLKNMGISEVFVFEGGEEEVEASSPDTPMQDASDQLRWG